MISEYLVNQNHETLQLLYNQICLYKMSLGDSQCAEPGGQQRVNAIIDMATRENTNHEE